MEGLNRIAEKWAAEDAGAAKPVETVD